MTERGRLIAVIAGSTALLALVFFAPTWSHLLAWGVCFSLCRTVAPALRRGLGTFPHWALALVVLLGVGALLGPKDARFLGVPVSLDGALAATTMIARAFGLVALSTGLLALHPPARLVGRLSRTRFRRIGEVVVVAVELLPSLAAALRGARADIALRYPGWRAHRRIFATLVFTVEHAADLAETLSHRLAASGEQEESA